MVSTKLQFVINSTLLHPPPLFFLLFYLSYLYSLTSGSFCCNNYAHDKDPISTPTKPFVKDVPLEKPPLQIRRVGDVDVFVILVRIREVVLRVNLVPIGAGRDVVPKEVGWGWRGAVCHAGAGHADVIRAVVRVFSSSMAGARILTRKAPRSCSSKGICLGKGP